MWERVECPTCRRNSSPIHAAATSHRHSGGCRYFLPVQSVQAVWMDDPIDSAAFAHSGMVRDLLRLLPRGLTRDLDLRRLPSANIGKGAKRRLADMPVSFGFRPSAGRPRHARLLLMLEFQSTVERHMALRLDAYAALTRQDLLRRGLLGPSRKLPEVLCVVVYTGRQRWTAPLNLGELTECGLEARTPLQPELSYLVLDGEPLGEQDSGRGRRGNRALALIALQRCARAADLPGRVKALFDLLRGPADAALRRDLKDVLGGMIATRFGGAGADVRLALDLMEEPMGLAMRFDEWEAEFLHEGRQQGREEGREAGLEEGRTAGLEEGWAAERSLLRRLAARRFDAATAEALFGMLTGVRDAERFAVVGEFIVDCATGRELLDRVRQTDGEFA